MNKEEQIQKAANAIDQACANLAEFLKGKNRKYGNSVFEPQRVFSKAAVEDLIDVRLDDKISRILSGQLDDDEDPQDDLLGYLLLKKAYRIYKND
jgi:hypothetical protein